MWFNFHVSKKLSGGLACSSNGGIAYSGRFFFKGSTKSNKIIKVEFSYLPCIRGKKTDTSDVFGSKFDLHICSSILLCESIVIEK